MSFIEETVIEAMNYTNNVLKNAIKNNDPIEEKLHVIAVVSNACLYKKRYTLARQFIQKIESEEPNVILYVVELAYKDQSFAITDANNNRHLQLRTDVPLWHKENIINIGIKKLLPENWKAVAWIDADIEFKNPNWALDTLKILNGCKDFIQLFTHCIDTDNNNQPLSVYTSFGYKYTKEDLFINREINCWHPGFAWACHRKAYDQIGGLYVNSILGSGDNIMALSLINNGLKSISNTSTDAYKNSIIDFQNKINTLRLGYVPGVIIHSYHGSKTNRKYTDRWKILLKYNYNPELHLSYDTNGVIIPSEHFPDGLKDEIFNYFKERNEDE